MRKPMFCTKTKAQISFAVTVRLISAFVSAAQIVQFLYFLNPKFPTSSHLLCLYRLVCVGPILKAPSWFSRVAAHMFHALNDLHLLSQTPIPCPHTQHVCCPGTTSLVSQYSLAQSRKRGRCRGSLWLVPRCGAEKNNTHERNFKFVVSEQCHLDHSLVYYRIPGRYRGY